ncbi:MAG: hypothetical protein ACMXYC_01320 [Candidatus Woesearchaeota archaeon]
MTSLLETIRKYLHLYPHNDLGTQEELQILLDDLCTLLRPTTLPHKYLPFFDSHDLYIQSLAMQVLALTNETKAKNIVSSHLLPKHTPFFSFMQECRTPCRTWYIHPETCFILGRPRDYQDDSAILYCTSLEHLLASRPQKYDKDTICVALEPAIEDSVQIQGGITEQGQYGIIQAFAITTKSNSAKQYRINNPKKS